MQVFDVEKCFDALWLQECINDVYDAGLQNDKLNLLFLENVHAQVAIKTSNGKSKRIGIDNIIMQGSVWGSLLCTTSMDKLGQMFYENEELLYWYKGNVAVPPLCMVDDVLAVQTCSQASVKVNAVINQFIELKKLTLSDKKCSKIHVGKSSDSWPAKIKETIGDRKSKGYGIVSEIPAILNEIPLGIYKLEMGLKLRQAMLVNGILFNSEGWHGVTEEDIRTLEKVDEALLRFMLQCHAKAPLVFLYLEKESTF